MICQPAICDNDVEVIVTDGRLYYTVPVWFRKEGRGQ